MSSLLNSEFEYYADTSSLTDLVQPDDDDDTDIIDLPAAS
jgi:hypothetical protein